MDLPEDGWVPFGTDGPASGQMREWKRMGTARRRRTKTLTINGSRNVPFFFFFFITLEPRVE